MAIPLSLAGWDDKSISNEAVLINWFVRPGQTVQRDQLLAEVMVEKVNLEVIAPQAGIIQQIIVPEGGIVTPGSLLALLEELPAISPSPLTTPNGSTPRPKISKNHYIPASPVARRLARQLNLDLNQISEQLAPGARLNEAAVQQFLERNQPASKDSQTQVPARRLPQPNLRKLIRSRVSRAFYQSAPVTLTTRADVSRLLDCLEEQNQQLALDKAPLTLLAAVFRASALTLLDYPLLNAALDGDEVIYYEECNIALVVGVPKGIVLPVVRRVEQLSLLELVSSLAELTQAARQGTLQLKDTLGSTFTIVDLGEYGITSFTPVLNQPQAAILGIGCVLTEPVPLEEPLSAKSGDPKWAWRKIITLNLTFNHCLADGPLAAAYLKRLVDLLERPETLLPSL